MLPDNLKTINGFLKAWCECAKQYSLAYHIIDKPNCIVVVVINNEKNVHCFIIPGSNDIFKKIITDSFEMYTTGEIYETEEQFQEELQKFIFDFIWTF